MAVALVVALGPAPAASGAGRSGERGARAVSPGTEEALVTIADGCPTFSWSGDPGAEAYEVAVYRLTDGGTDSEPALRQEVPGPSFAWTPSTERCLASGERYAWAVRERLAGRWREWSPASLFAVAAGPSPGELAQALEVVRHYLAVHPEAGPEAMARGPETAPAKAGEAPAGGGADRESSLGRKAIIAPDRVGLSSRALNAGGDVVYAVHGFTTSSQTGSAAVVGESNAEIFNVATYGVLGIHRGNDSLGAAGAFYRIQGGDLLQGYFGDQEVFSVDTAGNSFLGGHLDLSGSLNCNSCITGLDILNGSLQGADLQDGTVSGADLQNNSVGEADLAAGSVGADELDQVVVVSVECNGECTDITVGQVCNFAGTDKRPVFVDCRDVDDDAGSACGGDNVCAAFTLDAADSLGSLCTDGAGWDANVYCLDDDDGGYP